MLKIIRRLKSEDFEQMVQNYYSFYWEVKDDPQVAKKLYKNLGFKTCGVLPRDVRRGGEYYDEELMYLNIDEFSSSAQPQITELNPKENKVTATRWK